MDRKAYLKANPGALAGVVEPDQVAKLRRLVEAHVERLIELLDHLDGDTDLEDGYDREQVCEDEGAQCDDEGYQQSELVPLQAGIDYDAGPVRAPPVWVGLYSGVAR